MARVQYYYNPETCDYEKINPWRKRGALLVSLFLFLGLLFAYSGILLYESYFPSWKESQLVSVNANLEKKWELLEIEVNQLSSFIEELWIHDEEIRKILERERVYVLKQEIGTIPRFYYVFAK